jgi:hypothetical protein
MLMKTYSHAKAALASRMDVRIFGDSWIVKSDHHGRSVPNDLHRLGWADERHCDSEECGDNDGDDRIRFHFRKDDENETPTA